MSLVAGIDFSSLAIDVVLVDLDDREPPLWERFALTGADAFERTRNVRAVMPTSSFYDDILAIGIEHPAGKFGTGPMMRVQGAVLACLPAGVLVQPWPPSAWRKAVGLAGNASKWDVSAFVMLNSFTDGWKTDERALEQDACDAYCIALATRSAIETEAAA